MAALLVGQDYFECVLAATVLAGVCLAVVCHVLAHAAVPNRDLAAWAGRLNVVFLILAQLGLRGSVDLLLQLGFAQDHGNQE